MRQHGYSISQTAERHVVATVERIASGSEGPTWLVRATYSNNPTVAHVRKCTSESVALGYAADAA